MPRPSLNLLLRTAVLIPVLVQSGLAQIERPRLGEILDARGFLHSVYGVAASFTVEDAHSAGVLATACNGTICLAKTASSLIAETASGTSITPAPPGPAAIGLDGDRAVLYFAQTGQFERWQAGTFTPLPVAIGGDVLAVASIPSGLEIAVRRSTRDVWIVSETGAALDSLPPETSAVLLLPQAIVYSTPHALVLRRPDRSEMRFAAPGVRSLYALGADYVEAQAGSTIYALRTTPAKEQRFLLPQPHDLQRSAARPRPVRPIQEVSR